MSKFGYGNNIKVMFAAVYTYFLNSAEPVGNTTQKILTQYGATANLT